jgi:hypothetical protein
LNTTGLDDGDTLSEMSDFYVLLTNIVCKRIHEYTWCRYEPLCQIVQNSNCDQTNFVSACQFPMMLRSELCGRICLVADLSLCVV